MSGEGCEGVDGCEVGGGSVEDFVVEVSEGRVKGEEGVDMVLGRSSSIEVSSSESLSTESLDWCTPLSFPECVCV